MSTDCPFLSDVLLLGDGELSFERAVTVEAHLAVCPSCAATEELLFRVESVALREADLGAIDAALARLDDPVVETGWTPWLVAACALLALGFFAPRPVPTREPAVARGGSDTVEVAAHEDQAQETARVATEPGGTDRFALPPPHRRRIDVQELLAGETSVELVAAQVRGGGLAASASLVSLLASDDDRVRQRALEVARRADDAVVVEGLVERVTTVGDRGAWDVLADLSARGTESALGLGLDDERRAAALAALERVGTTEARDEVVAHARSATATEFAHALETLRRLDPRTALRVLVEQDQDPEWRPVIVGVVRSDPEHWLPALHEAVRRGDVLVARAACEVLAAHGDTRSTDALADAVARRGLRDAALAALVELGGESAWRIAARQVARRPALATHFDGAEAAGGALARGVETWSDVPLATLIELLGRCGGEESFAALDRLIASGLQSSALPTALARAGGEDAVARLVDLLDQPRLGPAAVEALGVLPVGRVVPELLRRFDDDRRSRIHEALVRIAGQDLGRERADWTAWWNDRG